MRQNDGMRSQVVASKVTMKGIHDTLVDAWDQADGVKFGRAIATLEDVIGSAPRRACGGRRGGHKVYDAGDAS